LAFQRFSFQRFSFSKVNLRLQLLQVCRLAPRLLGDSTSLVQDFYRRQFNDHGAALDRGGRPDLYYTIFSLAGAQALDVAIPLESTREWLLSFEDGVHLDFVHLGALARCWAAVGLDEMPADLGNSLLEGIEK